MSASPQMHVRRLEVDDLEELVELCREHAEYERSDWRDEVDESASRIERWRSMGLIEGGDTGRATDSAFCWVIEGTNELAGFASVFVQQSTWDASPYLYLDCLYLRPAYRSQGLGSLLFGRVERSAQRLGGLDVQWQTPEWNEGAERFYRRLGATSKRKLRFTLASDR